ncbi:MAG: Uma2 family endonuclease [Desertifilum sp. SIO1I2]|nr:Uma2 family endonuclease [Desertifilum sp. SIO1I2]
METLTLNLAPALRLTDEQFYALCMANQAWRLEMTETGALIIMPPTGGESGIRNSALTTELTLWNRQTQFGVVFDSSTVFQLPDGSKRSPDASWVTLERWQALSAEARRKFPPLCPDFVVELRSETDSLSQLQAKMQAYLANGIRLGWLIDPLTPLVEIYRPQQPVETLNFATEQPPLLSGEEVLPGFLLDVGLILNI